MTARALVRAAVLGSVGAAATAQAQWVTFADETGSRLSLSTVPLKDTEEKDLVAADFDGDGWTDVMVGRKKPFTNPGKKQAVLLMNEGGVLVDRTKEYAPGMYANTPDEQAAKWMDCRDVAAADFDGDGWLDLMFGNTFGQPPKYFRNRGLDKEGNWLGFEDESKRIGSIAVNPIQVCAVWTGDVTGNGAPDAYFTNYNGGTDFILINDGAGNFTEETAQRLGNYANSGFGTANEVLDVDGDGDLDIIKCTTLFGKPPFDTIGVFVLFNNGSGVFNARPFYELPGTDAPYMFSTGDYDGDGWPDVYVVQDGQDQVIFQKERGADTVKYGGNKEVVSGRTNGLGGNNHPYDVDGDGHLDIGVAPIDVDIANCGFGAKMTILRNGGTGQLVDPYQADQPFMKDAHDFAWVDVNNDGCIDIVSGLCGSNGTAGYGVYIQQDCEPPCYADFDGNGLLNLFDFLAYTNAFNAGAAGADCDGNGLLNLFDFLCFTNKFNAGC